jgi:hypothetical protein
LRSYPRANLRHRIVSLKENDRRHRVSEHGRWNLRNPREIGPTTQFRVLGEGLDWLIVDEASRLKPAIWQGHLSQRLIDKHGWALLISTPKGKGYFYDLFRRGQGQDSDYQSWNMPVVVESPPRSRDDRSGRESSP